MSLNENFASIASKRRKIEDIVMKRATCLNLFTKEYKNRAEIVQKLKELNFPLSNIVGIAELRKGYKF